MSAWIHHYRIRGNEFGRKLVAGSKGQYFDSEQIDMGRTF